MNPLALAYLGDAVYEMCIRQYLLSLPNNKPDHLNREAVKWVSAKAQSRLLALWQPHLTEQEADVARRGRNAKSHRQPKNAHVLEYRSSTGFECLIGYWYLTGGMDRFVLLLERTIAGELALSHAESDTNGEGGENRDTQPET